MTIESALDIWLSFYWFSGFLKFGPYKRLLVSGFQKKSLESREGRGDQLCTD